MNHLEEITLYLMPSPSSPLVLGLPLAPSCPDTMEPILKTLDLSPVPEIYHDLAEVFSKEKALSLPAHQPYDCVIDLLPGVP